MFNIGNIVKKMSNTPFCGLAIYQPPNRPVGKFGHPTATIKA